ncbi:hypothetical protein J1TS3_05570 [Siminovitchia fordii]|uniref:Uncharacterized protein n=1 Tax=Siminovitchia fordii TaxID=254759 RepID=A0ABQ4K3H3_9BACI|nr:hypothetical protein J1TS3_05570 [Siminovitchia fordii]
MGETLHSVCNGYSPIVHNERITSKYHKRWCKKVTIQSQSIIKPITFLVPHVKNDRLNMKLD